MSADFGAELEAALNGHLGAIRAAADGAKERIDEGIAGVHDEPDVAFPDFSGADGLDDLDAPAAPAHHAAAVDFDLEEVEDAGAGPLDFDTMLDGDGIPPPEEI